MKYLVICLLLLIPTNVMAITKVQQKTQTELFGGEIVTFDSPVTAGNLILVFVPELVGTTTITDNQGNTYTAVSTNRLYYTVASASGTLSITFDVENLTFYDSEIVEFSGVNTFDSTDTTGFTFTGSSSGTVSLSTGTPSQAEYLAIGFSYMGYLYTGAVFPYYNTLQAPFTLINRTGDLDNHYYYAYNTGTDGVADTFALTYEDWAGFGAYNMVVALFYYVEPTNPCVQIRGKCKIRGKVKLKAN